MTKIRKLLALLLVAVITVTAVSVTSFASPYDEAVAIDSGVKVTGKLPGTDGRAGVTYEFTTQSKGTLTLNCSVGSGCSYVHVFDEDGAYLTVETLEIKAGRLTRYDSGGEGKDFFRGVWNETSERFTAKATYEVGKGTYYITVSDDYSFVNGDGDGTVKLTATYPTEEDEVSISYLSITLKKGDTLQLGAVLTGGKDTIKWSSSKKTVASVTSSGKVSAKKKGSAIITAKCGESIAKIKITVK